MKTTLIIQALMALFLVIGCTQQKSTDELLSNKDDREKIMQTITADQEMMNEMMNYMMQSDKTIGIMQGNRQMMEKMMGNRQMMMNIMQKDTATAGRMMNNMIGMMEKDSTFCKIMCRKINDNRHMMGMMHGIVNDSMMVCPLHQKEMD